MDKQKLTKYEAARMLGSRSLQIAMGAPYLIKLTQEELERIHYDSFEIAKKEMEAGAIPLSIKRTLPQPEGLKGDLKVEGSK